MRTGAKTRDLIGENPGRRGKTGRTSGGTGIVVAALTTAVLASASGSAAGTPGEQPLSLQGTWVLTAAYELTADGTRTTNFSEHPEGLLMVDSEGRYSLQIFRPDRPKFASGDKTRGTPDEYREAVLGSSTHTGHVAIDSAHSKLIFKIDTASYPNWEGAQQIRDYTYKDDTLTYSVPASASGNGTIAYSVWRHLHE